MPKAFEVYYNHAGDFGPGWASESKRFFDKPGEGEAAYHFTVWLNELLAKGKEVLITAIVEL